MMPRRLLLTTIAALLSLTVIVRAADDLVLARFSDYLDALRVQAGIPGLSAAIVGATSVTWEHAYGLQDVDRNVQARLDTPYHIDGLTQTIVASLLLRCADSGWISLDDRVGKYAPGSADAGATLRQLLTHTSLGANGLVFNYRTDRLEPLAAAVAACTDSSFAFGVAALLGQRLGMFDSVPGVDAIRAPLALQFDAATVDRYSRTLNRLAAPYSVDAKGHPSPGSYAAATLTPGAGLVSTLLDLEQFDLDEKRGVLVPIDTLAAAWTPPLDGSGQRLPHGIGWFLQTYNGEPVVWQFGVGDNASSSMTLLLPKRNLTLILLANSQGLSRPFSLAAGDVTVSPFAKLFLGLFTR
jgi:CubicO group peptidase (beta-lactamase class C family)